MKNSNNPIDNWFSFISDKTNKNSDQIIPLYDLSILIEEIFEHSDCPLSGLEVTIKHYSIEFCSRVLGELSDSPEIIKDPFGGDPEAQSCIKYNLKNKNIASTIWYSKFVNFLTSVWLPTYRKHGELDLKNTQLPNLLPAALEKISLKSPSGIYCIFADLDKFKTINDQLGHSTGNKAIQDVLGCIENIAQSERIICTIDGGDEFVLFIENKGDTNLLLTLDKIGKLIANLKYGYNNLTVGITFGVKKLDSWNNVETIKENIEKAEQATKQVSTNGNLEKKRGTVSFSEQPSFIESKAIALDERNFIQLAISLIRSRQNSALPFSNALLNFVSNVTFHFFKENQNHNEFIRYIDGYIQWLGISFCNLQNEIELIGAEHRNPIISKISFALAVAHGLLKSHCTYNLSVKIKDEALFALFDMNSGTLLWGDVIEESTITQFYEIGASIKENNAVEPLSNCVLISLGLSQDLYMSKDIVLPHNLFADIIFVDGRPVSGGGLPDFWQAAMAQLISVISGKNINKVLVYGDENGAPNVINLLNSRETFTIDDIAELSASARPEAEKCINLLKNKKTVVFCQSSILNVITALYESMLELKSALVPNNTHKKSIGFLTRPLYFPESELPLIHGMRCSTAAMAYPAVLEQLRSNDDDEINTYDNAEQLLKEVIGFKLVLDTPLKDCIPDYWMRSENALSEYTKNILIDPSGLIGKKLTENGQFDAFLKHLYSYCIPSGSTRRAILIVPNQFDADDMNPLGLVSVWVTPRFREDKYILDYCFIWRTVEALVGFPYSLYGSIQLANYIRQKLDNNFCFESSRSSNLRVGKLTYIALSLHMKTDIYNKRIAKSIVDAASI